MSGRSPPHQPIPNDSLIKTPDYSLWDDFRAVTILGCRKAHFQTAYRNRLFPDEKNAIGGPQVLQPLNRLALAVVDTDGCFFQDFKADGAGELSEIVE